MGKFKAAVDCKYANYVLQTLIEQAPEPLCIRIFENLQQVFEMDTLARHEKGTRVLQRLLERIPIHMGDWIDQLMQNCAILSQHQFANYVLQVFVEVASVEQKERLVDSLFAQFLHATYSGSGLSAAIEVLAGHAGQVVIAAWKQKDVRPKVSLCLQLVESCSHKDTELKTLMNEINRKCSQATCVRRKPRELVIYQAVF